MPRTTCLTEDEISAFHLGDLPETTLDALAAHLESCSTCEAAVRALDGLTDPVMSAIRQTGLAAPLTNTTAPARVHEYEILEEIGRGGMGVVYRARHLSLHRIVALKMLLGGAFTNREERARFRTEAEAVARLQHPGIVQIYDIGEYDPGDGSPRPYFTLEFVEGGNLSHRLAGRPQPPRQAASWLEALARAAHYAHQHGIVHRDLKPSNVLLTEDGQPKLCDFGVAKLLVGSDVKTMSGMLLGTAEYMAPEQAAGATTVGPAGDIYALGAILYATITGRPPFQGTSPLHTLEQVRTQEPVSLRRLLPLVPRDLDTICLKCLEKDPAKRYASAEALADDLRRFLAGEPIVARPVGALERAVKWMRRYPTIAGLLATVVLVTAIGVGLLLGLWRQAEARVKAESDARTAAQEKEEHEKQARRATTRLMASITLDHGQSLCAQGDVGPGLLHMARALRMATEVGATDLERVARVNLAAWRPRLIVHRANLAHTEQLWALAFSPDSQTILTGGRDNVARRWDARTGRCLGELPHHYPVWTLAFSPDGKLILSGSGDDTKHKGEVRLWDATGKPLTPPLPHPDEVHVVQFSADGQRFLTVCDDEARLFQTASPNEPGRLIPHPQPEKRRKSLQPRLCGMFSPDGKTILTGGEDGTARLWDGVTGAPKGEPLQHDGPVLSLAFSPDSKTVLTGSFDGTARLWDVETCKQRGLSLRCSGRVLSVAFSSDGVLVATGSTMDDVDLKTMVRSARRGGEARIWRAATGEPVGDPLRHSEAVWSVAFRPGGHMLLTGSEDMAARFFAPDGSLLAGPMDNGGTVANVLFSPDGRLALTACAGGTGTVPAQLWELAPIGRMPRIMNPIPRYGSLFVPMCFLPDTRHLALTAVDRKSARVYDLATGRQVGTTLTPPDLIDGLVCSPDGRTLLIVVTGQVIQFWDWSMGKVTAEGKTARPVQLATFGPDGQTFAICNEDREVQLWQRSPVKPLGPPLPQSGHVHNLSIGPNNTILTRVDKRQVRLWNGKTGELLCDWKTPAPVIVTLFVAGKAAAVLGEPGQATQVWDVQTQQPMSAPLTESMGRNQTVAFGPDGQSILMGNWERKLAGLWDMGTGKPLGPSTSHTHFVCSVASSTDGQRVASISLNGQVLSAGVAQPLAGEAERLQCWVEVLTRQTLDERGIVKKLTADELRERRQQLQLLGGPPDGME